MVKIKIIIGSIRPNRFGPKPAQWILDLAQQRTDAQFELVDIADQNLPLLDEPQPAATANGDYAHEHTKRWSRVIAEADGFVFVTPEYNFSIAPSLKNALDYLYKEWFNKPVAFVSYGSIGGGLRAVEHLRGVAGQLRLFDLNEGVVIPNYWEFQDKSGAFVPTERQIKAANTMLDSLVFWTKQLQRSRRELAEKVTA